MDPHTHGVGIGMVIGFSPVEIHIWIMDPLMDISIWRYPYGYPYGDIYMGIPTGKNPNSIPTNFHSPNYCLIVTFWL